MTAEQILKTKIIEKAWQDPAFKKQLLADPKAAIKAAFGLTLPDDVAIETVEETPNKLYLVLPANPTESLDGTAVPASMW